MNSIQVQNNEIEIIEELLLPEGSHFSDDAKTVISCWESTDVSACPGSGKTTVLLAKLKIILASLIRFIKLLKENAR